jgi:hypothetical protein
MVFFGSGRKHTCDTGSFAIFVIGIDSEFNETEELAGLMGMKGTTAAEDLHDEIKKVLPKLNVPLRKLIGVVIDGVPFIAGKNSGLSLLITKNVKNAAGHGLYVILQYIKKVCVPNP